VAAGDLAIGDRATRCRRTLDSLRIAVRPTPDELQVYKGASWAKRPSEQSRTWCCARWRIRRRITAVAPNGSGMTADYTLLMELRRYEADYAGNNVPAATIEINAKLLHARTQAIVASRTFLQAVPAGGTDTASVVQAFGAALGTLAHDVADGRWRPATQARAHRRRPRTRRAAPMRLRP
jgi:cholesterol transport system auxiliary component